MHIPKGAIWYLAEIVEEISVEGENTNVVHIDLLLIYARSPEEALEKAQQHGMAREQTYENPKGKAVRVTYRGLHDLHVIYEDLKDGCELLYEERIGLNEDEIRKLVVDKYHLTVFRPPEPINRPDFSSKEVQEEANRLIQNDSVGNH